MTSGSAAGFARGASLAVAIGAAALLPWFTGNDRLAALFAATGFLAMALPGLAAGAWLAHEHGRARSRFAMALGAGFLSRLVLAALAAMGAAQSGPGAIGGLLPGLAAGFAPLLAFEMIWFARKAGAADLRTESRG